VPSKVVDPPDSMLSRSPEVAPVVTTLVPAGQPT
jgi:hypothetical protein